MKLHYQKRNEVIEQKKSVMFSSKQIEMIEKQAKEENRTFGGFVRHTVNIYMTKIELNKKGDVKTSPGTKF
jgi:hypothetical protein